MPPTEHDRQYDEHAKEAGRFLANNLGNYHDRAIVHALLAIAAAIRTINRRA